MICELRKIISRILYYSGITYFFYKKGNNNAIILAYHRVLDLDSDFPFDENSVSASVDNFRKQIECISKKYNVISLEKFVEHCKRNKNLPKNSVVITFDDGYIDNYLFAYPVLKKHNIPATIFLTTNYIGTNEIFWWDKITYAIKKTKIRNLSIDALGSYDLRSKKGKARALKRIICKLKQLNEKEKNNLIEDLIKKLNVSIPKKIKRNTLSWKEVVEMSKNNISFGSHTLNHPILTNISIKEAENEIKESKRVIEDNIKKKIKFFCYPNGEFSDFDDNTKKILNENDIECAVTYVPGFSSINSDLFELRRVFVNCDDDIILLKNKLMGMDIFLADIYNLFNRLIKKRLGIC